MPTTPARLAASLPLLLAACAGPVAPVDATVDASSDVLATTDAPVDATPPDASPDATPDAFADPHDGSRANDANVPRCGPGAVAYRTDVGRCYVENPVPAPGVQTQGHCSATNAGAMALAKTNAREGDHLVIPSGRRVTIAPSRIALPGFPMAMLVIPGTHFVVVTDGGYATEHLRVIDVNANPPVVTPNGDATFPTEGAGSNSALFYGLAYDATNHLLYASGGGSDRIQVFTLDTVTGALTAEPARTIDFGVTEGMGDGIDAQGHLVAAYPAGLALSSDRATLYVALQRGHALAVVDVVTRAVTQLIPMPGTQAEPPYPYALAMRPGDDTHVYVGLWGGGAVAEVDVVGHTVARTFAVGKNPSGMRFDRDGRTLWVTAADSDALTKVDVGLANPTPVRTQVGSNTDNLRGTSPVAIAQGNDSRLYVAEAFDDWIDVVDGTTLAHVGRIPTEWHPSDVAVMDDGRVLVLTGKGLGSNANTSPDTQEITDLMSGSLGVYAPRTDAMLQAGNVEALENVTLLSHLAGVSCGEDLPYDFPVPLPSTPVGGHYATSSLIKHVIVVVRENKTYDAVLGNWAGTSDSPADGDPSLTILPRAQMPAVYPNLEALVARFAGHDNYYSNAEQSSQGHVWLTQGRTTDFTERTWLSTSGRSDRGIPAQGTLPIGQPEEGTMWAALARANVSTMDWGEVTGSPGSRQFASTRYPGAVFSLNIPDITKALAFGASVVGCDLPTFTYILLPRDHTFGGGGGHPTPASMFADNDEATGYLVDAVSHSSFWPETLIVVVEDDPQDGGDHVDNHRAMAVFVSPWVRRGYTSHVHADESSLYRTIGLIVGLPPPNAAVANATPMYDVFTGTPDYTPFTYTPRHACDEINPSNSAFADRSRAMDFSVPDEAPGLSRLVWAMTHGGREAPWREVRGDEDGDGD